MKLKHIVAAQRRLDNARATKLEESDVIKLLKNRKAMRPYVNDFEEFEKDCKDKFKVEGLEDAEKVRQGVVKKLSEDKSYQPTKDEIESINKVLGYLNKVNKALSEELDKEIDITFDKLSENADAKLMKENGWSYAEIDEIEVMF